MFFIMVILKAVRIGNSTGVIVPRKICNQLGIQIGNFLSIQGIDIVVEDVSTGRVIVSET